MNIDWQRSIVEQCKAGSVPVTKMVRRLKRTGRWMMRQDYDGVSDGGRFRWRPVGQWVTAPDWSSEPACGRGLHGQGPGGYGYCHAGTRWILCETGAARVALDDKVKVRRARIIAVDADAWELAVMLCDGTWPGSVDLDGYGHALPEGLTTDPAARTPRGFPEPPEPPEPPKPNPLTQG